MNASSTPRPTRRVSATVLASLGVVGAAAAVAGMGTFGAFTDSTAPSPASIRSATVSIDLSAADGSATVPLAFTGVVPGSSVSQAVDLVNDGNSALAAVQLATVATQSSILDTDTADGLQMTVQSCTQAWAPDATCAGTVSTLLASGPVVRAAELTSPASRTVGATDHVLVSLALPASAGDAFKQASSQLALTFTATQRAALAH